MIELRSLSKKFPNEETIRYKDMDFATGESYMLLGASGCGKSTLLNMIAGILPPETGSITIDGREMTSLSQKEKDAFRIAHIGYIFQDFKLLEEMTVEDNIHILRLEGIDTSRTPEILSLLGMEKQKNKKIRQLSGGQKQRVAIARAIVKQPDIILADEPTGNLNFAIGEEVISLLSETAREKTLITVSHDERLGKYFDHVLSMDELVERGE